MRKLKNGIEVSRSRWRGVEFFDLAMLFFGNNIKSINTLWSSEYRTDLLDNLNTVNNLTSANMPFDEAITKTWSAQKVAFRHGFRKVSIEEVKGEMGNYTVIKLKFLPSDNFEVTKINSSI